MDIHRFGYIRFSSTVLNEDRLLEAMKEVGQIQAIFQVPFTYSAFIEKYS